LASAQSVRAPLRRNRSGIAEKTSVPISRGGASRYIIAWFCPFYAVRSSMADIIRGVDRTDLERPVRSDGEKLVGPVRSPTIGVVLPRFIP
jgi:hypothetical protein